MLIQHSNTSVRPFLRWAGSKKQLLPILSNYWNNTNIHYIEPFVGSASLFFHLNPSSAILGDINKELIYTYKQLQCNVENVLIALKLLQKNEEEYYKIRETTPNNLSSDKRAARFIYLNRFCFNGLYRTNKSGVFNVPYGGDKASGIPPDNVFRECSLLLQKAKLFACSFEKTLEKAKPGDFVYMDPPYSVSAERTFNEYDSSIFNQTQLNILRDWMWRLNNIGVQFLVSYAESIEGNILSQGFNVEIVDVKRNIAGFTANRRHANELLISNIQ